MKKTLNLTGKTARRRAWRAAVASASTVTVVMFAILGPAGSQASAATASTAPRITTPSTWQYTAGGYSVFTVTATGSPTPTFTVSGTPSFLLYYATTFGAVTFWGYPPADEGGKAYTVTITAANGTGPNAVQHLVMMAGTTTTTTSLSASPSPAVAGHAVTYTARVAPVPSGGTVNLFAPGLIPGCISLPVSPTTGTATCSSTSLLAGNYDLYATYSGDGLFLPSNSSSIKLVVYPRTPAYWLATTNGRVFGLGTAPFLGNANTSAGRAMAGTADGEGYYVVGAGGGVFAFGDATFYGSVPGLGKRVNNIVAIAPTSDGKGYYLLGSDGGIFTFGDARFYGSLPGIGIRTEYVVGMVAYPASTGYLLVSRDGGVFTFGNAKFYGSLPGMNIRTTSIRGILPASAGTGYVLVGADGGVFNFGTGVRFYGSLPGIGVKVNNIVGIALTRDQDGYYMAGSDGRVYGFGTATVAATPSELRSNLPLAAIAGIPPLPPTIGYAQRIFQGIQHYAPGDKFKMLSGAEVTPGAPPGYAESSVGFQCLTCGFPPPNAYTFSLQWFGSHDAAIGYAVTYIKVAEEGALSFQAFAPQYVAGNAVMSPLAPTPWPPPNRIITAFGQAVGQPVVNVVLP